MRNPEAHYINAGARYERASTRPSPPRPRRGEPLGRYLRESGLPICEKNANFWRMT